MSKPDLDAIQKRADAARDYASRVHIQESADDVPALIAYARDLEARLGRVEKLCEANTFAKGLVQRAILPEAIRAALTATEGPA